MSVPYPSTSENCIGYRFSQLVPTSTSLLSLFSARLAPVAARRRSLPPAAPPPAFLVLGQRPGSSPGEPHQTAVRRAPSPAAPRRPAPRPVPSQPRKRSPPRRPPTPRPYTPRRTRHGATRLAAQRTRPAYSPLCVSPAPVPPRAPALARRYRRREQRKCAFNERF